MDYPSLSHVLSSSSSSTPKKRSHIDQDHPGEDDPNILPPVDQDPAYDASLLSPQATRSSFSTRREVSIVETYASPLRQSFSQADILNVPAGRSTEDHPSSELAPTNMEGIEPDPHLGSVAQPSLNATPAPAPEVSFRPPLSLQRIRWALDVLRREGVSSVLDIGCGEGTLLEALCQPAGTIPEDPIRSSAPSSSHASPARRTEGNGSQSRNGRNGGRSSRGTDRDAGYTNGKNERAVAGGKEGESGSRMREGGREEFRELFLHRIAGLDVDPTVIPKAVAVTAPALSASTSSDLPHMPSSAPTPPESQIPPIAAYSADTYLPPRWQRTDVEIWNGGLERHNHRLEGYEAIVALEVIEHLDQPSFDILPQIIFGTYRPPLVLITTPNFEFNSKFPRVEDEEGCMHDDHREGGEDEVGQEGQGKKRGVGLGGRGGQWGQRGFLDPTGRTERVFRHSDHKLEMTEEEFRTWAEAAEEWGYSAEISGIGISNTPSCHDGDESRPLYATQTAVFRRGGQPTRSPRSVRTAQLPFIGGGEAMHPHKLAARHTHEPRGPGETLKHGRPMRPLPDETILDIVRATLTRFNIGTISLGELWGVEDVSRACAGSKRKLVSVLGGYGDVPPPETTVSSGSGAFEVFWPETEFGTLSLRWTAFAPAKAAEEEPWGTNTIPTTGVEVEMDDASGW